MLAPDSIPPVAPGNTVTVAILIVWTDPISGRRNFTGNSMKPSFPEIMRAQNLGNVPIRFRRAVSFLGLTEFRGESSVSSFQPIICVPTKRTQRVFFAELTEFAPKLSEAQ